MTFINDGRLQQKNMAADPATVSGYAHLYSKSKAGVSNLYWEADDGTEYDLSQLATPNTGAVAVGFAAQSGVALSGLASTVVISWDGTEFDTGGYWSGGNPTRLTIPTTGLYRVESQIEFEFNVPGNTYQFFVELLLNGGTIAAPGRARFTGSQASDPLGNHWTPAVSRLLSLTAGDYLEVNTGMGANTDPVAVLDDDSSWFSIQKI